MTINEYFKKELISKDQQRKKGFYFLLASFLFLCISTIISEISKVLNLNIIFHIVQVTQLIAAVAFYYGIVIYLFNVMCKFSLRHLSYEKTTQ